MSHQTDVSKREGKEREEGEGTGRERACWGVSVTCFNHFSLSDNEEVERGGEESEREEEREGEEEERERE